MRYTLRFGRFGWRELQAEARTTGVSEGDVARTAATELLKRVVDDDRGPETLLPRFRRDRNGAHEERWELEVELDPASAEALGDEATRQGVDIAELLEYAVLAHLAAQPEED